MHLHHLGPHTYASPPTHPRHREWLKCFTPRERHRLTQEDCAARWQVIGIMSGVLLAGLSMLVTVLLLAI
jgi:hypothetical protein